ncbi:MAG: DUF3107 domain-containing protein [Actinomycetota bacterium]|nr:DUF3107 domain-containing protein [Nocardioidaceae bacterium]MDQ3481439.1 DUF3107 domain-containing protein [Actinomycetota bacterium]
MEVKIGMSHVNREITLESTLTAEEVHNAVDEALKSDGGLLVLSDNKGRTVYVPTQKLGYVEISGETGRKVGFGAKP